MKNADNHHCRNPHQLPVKVCAHCHKSFTWRRKWARAWAEVKFCSDRCRAAHKRLPPANLCAAGAVDDEF
ncbi:DUF2256 domain-containing protein [Thalassolituus sp. LLYu03]|uniref:DUF2256 domain-containing protein n=1 Tax=Thalassolituus sp. LLYu03 TaxID=3421656 RepID=UPI003D28FF26